MKRLRRPMSDALPHGFSAEMLDILIDGWSAPQPADGYGEDHQRFDVFWLSDAQWRDLWQQHRALILAEWERRGGLGQPAGMEWFEDV
jgi:hypothetical protein